MAPAFPRPLRPKERDLLESVLPMDRPGYRHYRELLERMEVLGEGRRGAGNLVLGAKGDLPDPGAPLPPVVAYGVVETTQDQFTVTVREEVDNRIDVEILSSRGEEVPEHFEEKRRWSYSDWVPGRPSPATGERLREVQVDPFCTLAFAEGERRLWLYDARTGMNHPLPITGFYNELMLHKRIRDPEIALHSANLFGQLFSYSDDDLRAAFIAYNVLRKRVEVRPVVPERAGGKWRAALKSIFPTKGKHGQK
jgi:hypothetical protein